MLRNNILINTETRALKTRDYEFLGVAGENEIEQLVFKLTTFIDGIGIIEILKDNDKYYIELRRQDDSYILNIKNSLLSDVDEVSMQLHITTENTEVFKSKIFTFKVYEQIHATETIPDEYPEWIDTANARLQHVITECEELRDECIESKDETQEIKDECESIAEAVRDIASAAQYATWRVVPETMELQIKQPSTMSNTRWRLREGNLEVKII